MVLEQLHALLVVAKLQVANYGVAPSPNVLEKTELNFFKYSLWISKPFLFYFMVFKKYTVNISKVFGV